MYLKIEGLSKTEIIQLKELDFDFEVNNDSSGVSYAQNDLSSPEIILYASQVVITALALFFARNVKDRDSELTIKSFSKNGEDEIHTTELRYKCREKESEHNHMVIKELLSRVPSLDKNIKEE